MIIANEIESYLLGVQHSFSLILISLFMGYCFYVALFNYSSSNMFFLQHYPFCLVLLIMLSDYYWSWHFYSSIVYFHDCQWSHYQPLALWGSRKSYLPIIPIFLLWTRIEKIEIERMVKKLRLESEGMDNLGEKLHNKSIVQQSSLLNYNDISYIPKT